MQDAGVHTRVAGQHFERAARRRVAIKYAADIFSNRLEHFFPLPA